MNFFLTLLYIAIAMYTIEGGWVEDREIERSRDQFSVIDIFAE